MGIPMADTDVAAEDRANFADCDWVACGNFKSLGAAFGTDEFCNAQLRKRIEKARKLMTRIGEMDDPQTALLLLRYCAGYAKVQYSARTVPRHLQEEGLASYSVALRSAMETVLRRGLDERGWRQAQLGIADGGLGLRLPEVHAAAAYTASVRGARHKLEDMLASSLKELEQAETGALQELRKDLPEEAELQGPPGKGAQKSLSNVIDLGIRKRLKQGPGADLAYRQHLELQSKRGSGAWLTAEPGEGKHMEPELFRLAVARRLRQPICEKDTLCPFCGEIMDRFGDHALVCSCK